VVRALFTLPYSRKQMMSRSVGNRGPAQFEKPLTEVQKKRLQLVQEMREIYTKVRPLP